MASKNKNIHYLTLDRERLKKVVSSIRTRAWLRSPPVCLAPHTVPGAERAHSDCWLNKGALFGDVARVRVVILSP